MKTTDDLDDLNLLASTLFGEARGDIQPFGTRPLQAICHVIQNRVNARSRYGNTWREVILKPKQFSCWNEDDPNRALLLQARPNRTVTYNICKSVARQALEGTLGPDFTNGSNHYFSCHINAPWWCKFGVHRATIGSHLFYQL